eukprot:7945038-Pyramimonas_sp.AAC.1
MERNPSFKRERSRSPRARPRPESGRCAGGRGGGAAPKLGSSPWRTRGQVQHGRGWRLAHSSSSSSSSSS